MKEKYLKKMAMYQAITGIMEKNLGKIEKVSELKNSYENYISLNNKLIELKAEFEKELQPEVEKKSKAKENLINNAHPIANILQVYAFDLKDKSLSKKIDLSRNKLMKSKDSVLAEKCELLWKTVKSIYGKSIDEKESKKVNVLNLGSYGINGTLIDDLENANKHFIECILSLKDAISQKSKYGKKITVKIKEIDDLLRHKIDKLLTVFEIKEPAFYTEYKAARIITKEESKKKVAEKSEKPVIDKTKSKTQEQVKASEISTTTTKSRAKKVENTKI